MNFTKQLSILFIALGLSAISYAQTSKKVLFIGNSYTYVNDLPSLIDSIANHAGKDLIKDQSTPGGYTLEAHSTNTTTLSKISADNWDFVVIQEQSQRPSFPYIQVQADTYPYAKILCDSIRSANECAVPLFFNTWGRRDGDPQWDSINTFEKMNNRLYNAYEYMADVNSGMLSPIGIGFRHISDDTTSPISHTALYSSDGSHPSIYGSYLAACIFYHLIFDGSNALGNSYLPSGVSSSEAQYIQTVAYHVTTQVDSIQLDFTLPIANYSSTTNGLTATFTNNSQHAFTYLWSFGDGTTSTDETPIHTYTQAGDYSVTLAATNCSNTDYYSFLVTVSGTTNSVTEIESDSFYIYQNQTTQETYIRLNTQNSNVVIYNVSGQIVKQFTTNNNIIKLDLPQKGLYFISVNNVVKKIVY